MSLIDLGRNDVSEETQVLKDRLASRDTECAGLHTQLMRREAELDELRVTLNETIYKLTKEAERALHLEEEVSTRSSELKTERFSLRNTELALQSAQDRLKAEERAKRELESTLDTISLHSQTANVEHQSVQREKRALESRVRELERIVQTHEARRVSNIPHRSSRPRSSSVSNFRLPAMEQEVNDTKAQLHAAEMKLRLLEQKFAQTQDDLVKAENARISIDKAGQSRISELLSTLERKEEELESLREIDKTGEREEELLKRIDEDAAKITALEKLVSETQATRTSQTKIQKLQSQLKAEREKVHRSGELHSQLLNEKEELTRQCEASQCEIREGHELLIAREHQIKELEARHAHVLAELDTNGCRREPLSSHVDHSPSQSQSGDGLIASESALADHIQTLLQAIDRLRGERDGLKHVLEFSEVEYRITTEGFEARIGSLTRQLAESTRATTADRPSINERMEQRIRQLTSCATAFGVVISNLQTRLENSDDHLFLTTVDLTSSNSRLHNALEAIGSQKQLSLTNAYELDAIAKELTKSNEERDCLRLQLADIKGEVAVMTERVKASEADREKACQSFLLTEQRLATLDKDYQDIESERNSLALQVANLQDDLAHLRDELADTENRYNTLRAQQLSEMSTSGVVQALKDRIQELEAHIVHHTEQISDYRHDIRRLETNVKLHEERIADMVPELELLTSQKEAMVEDCAEARESRDDAIEGLEAAQEEVEQLQQQLRQMERTHDAELSAMSSMVDGLTAENQQATARLTILEAENAEFSRELDTLDHGHQLLNEHLIAAVSRSRSLELELSTEKIEMRQAVVSLAVIHRLYQTSARQLQGSYRQITLLKSRMVAFCHDLDQKAVLIDIAEKEKYAILNRLPDTPGRTGTQDDRFQMSPKDSPADLRCEKVHGDDREVDLLQNALQEKEEELVATKQILEEIKCDHSELVKHIATMTMELQMHAERAEHITSLQKEVENLRTQLRNSLENFTDLEKLHGDVIQEFAAMTETFGIRLTETDQQIRVLDADYQQSLSAAEAKYKHDTTILASNLEDRGREIDKLRQELQDISGAHARAEGKFCDELKSFEAQHTLATELEMDLRQTIADMYRRLAQAEAEALELQEERQLLQTEITGLQAEVQRSTSFTRYLESQIRESEDACMLLKESLQRSELDLAESEKASKAAEFNLTLQTTQHEKAVTALRREIASLQSGPDLRSAFTDLEEKNREIDDLLRAKCQEIEEYDDRILETLKANKKLTNKVESLARKVQALQTKLSSMKTQLQEPAVEVTPPKEVSAIASVPPSAPTMPSTRDHPASVHIRESSVPSLTLRSKTPEPRTQSVIALPSSHTPGNSSEPSKRETSAGKKRRAPDDDERDGVPAEGHYPMDPCFRNGTTPRLRRVHGHSAGFTPVRGGSSCKPAGASSPGCRANVVAISSEVITDVTNSPRGPSRQGDAQAKKKSWLGKIRGGAGSQPLNSRLGAFGGQ